MLLARNNLEPPTTLGRSLGTLTEFSDEILDLLCELAHPRRVPLPVHVLEGSDQVLVRVVAGNETRFDDDAENNSDELRRGTPRQMSLREGVGGERACCLQLAAKLIDLVLKP